jgi:hypothetical protein
MLSPTPINYLFLAGALAALFEQLDGVLALDL